MLIAPAKPASTRIAPVETPAVHCPTSPKMEVRLVDAVEGNVKSVAWMRFQSSVHVNAETEPLPPPEADGVAHVGTIFVLRVKT
jgi:hypothetical protein